MEGEHLFLLALLVVIILLQAFVIVKNGGRKESFSSHAFPTQKKAAEPIIMRISPEEMMEKERDSWLQDQAVGGIGDYDPEMGRNLQDDVVQYTQKAPTADYDSYLLREALDDKARENHSRWVEEMEPWSKTVRTRTEGLEMENYVGWQGLRPPQGIPQRPEAEQMQLTEIGSSDLAKNKRFVWGIV